MKKLISIPTMLMLFTITCIFAQGPDRSKWPAEYVHPDLPMYKAGNTAFLCSLKKPNRRIWINTLFN